MARHGVSGVRGFFGIGWLLALASAVLACAPDAPQQFDRVVFVSIDTLRSDHLGTYGYPLETSPFIDSLADRGVVFERAYAPMPTTAPSHATLFTSLHPVQHGVRNNGQQLVDDIETLAERLSAAGYTTAGFASTRAQWIPTGLHRGFETFEARAADDPAVYRTADRTVDAVLDWSKTCRDCDRLFLFVHLFDPHGPLRPPDPHLVAVRATSPEARERHAAYLAEEQGIPLDFYHSDPGRLLFLTDRYDAEIHFADAELRRLHEGLVEALGDVPTLWVVTSDHGEGLGNHDFMGHGKAYEEGLRVPLIFHATDGSLRARRLEEIVQHVDVAPTLLELTGQAPFPAAAGRSLAGALRGGELGASRPALAERSQIGVGPAFRRLPQEDPGDVSGEQFAWVEERFKYLLHTTGPDELYDLKADPHETRNLLAAEGAGAETGERLADALRAHLDTLPRHGSGAPEVELDEQTREELRALGYAP